MALWSTQVPDFWRFVGVVPRPLIWLDSDSMKSDTTLYKRYHYDSDLGVWLRRGVSSPNVRVIRYM